MLYSLADREASRKLQENELTRPGSHFYPSSVFVTLFIESSFIAPPPGNIAHTLGHS
jgi:hypothetical protein